MSENDFMQTAERLPDLSGGISEICLEQTANLLTLDREIDTEEFSQRCEIYGVSWKNEISVKRLIR